MILLTYSLLLGIILTAAAPWLYRRFPRQSAALSFFPLAVFIQLCIAIPDIAAGKVWHLAVPWVPSLGLNLNFQLDGLSLVMGLLISGIGALVIIYGGAYLHGHPFLGRFYSLVILFMTAMLGVVFSDNALLLFVFWELTSISSFFLIGFEHQKANARAAAWQALLVTGSGGLAMLAGFALVAKITGSFEISHWIASSDVVRGHPLAPFAFLLVLAGACTKSAQFPFHFWLPNAMEAPTPVSAYLHSATMVKAGVYLLARLFPVFGGLTLWLMVVTTIGLVTLVGGSLLALAQTDLKRLLAYTTVSALGSMVFFLGLGDSLAVKTAVVVLIAHALYKGALFLVAGSVDHGTGSRDITILGGAGRAMPFTAAAAGLAGLSMAGIPPLLGFVAKELMYETTLESSLPALLTGLLLTANVGMVAVAGWVGYQPFWGKSKQENPHPHEGIVGLWLPPLLLAVLSTLLGVFPQLAGKWLVAPAAQAIWQSPITVKLSLWHGFTPMLGLSALTLLLGCGLFAARKQLQPGIIRIWHALAKIGPAALYPRSLHAVLSFAAWQTNVLQNGYLRVYIGSIVLFTVGLAAITLGMRSIQFSALEIRLPRFYDVILIGIILSATFFVTRARSRLATIALLGSIGFSIAVLFLLYSAPDLAMVQFAIETLTVILFVLVLYRLPKFKQLSSRAAKTVDMLVALLGGLLMTMLMLIVSAHESASHLGRYFAESSLPLANGRNIVNVILVDFRGFDTLGEITVLAIAAMGVFSLIKLTVKGGRKRQVPHKGDQ
jgi:multicomponent Na+:H+ antiporter subunit A